jgi:hypothetical protein
VENVGVDIRAVDPRDQTSEVDDPAYCVYYWTSGGAACDEYECTQADVHAVIRLAEANADGRSYSLWAQVPDGSRTPSGVCLVRLAGWDPVTDPDVGRPAHAHSVPVATDTSVE